MTRAINPNALPVPPPPMGGSRERVGRAEPQSKPGSSTSQSESKSSASSLATSTAVPTQPNVPRDDAGRQGQQGGGQGGAGGGHAGDAQLAKALQSQGNTEIARAIVQLTSMANGEQLVGLSKDNVLLNLGPTGRHTFATGSLIPRKYLRHYHKLALGRRTDPWDADEREDSGPAMTADEYEILVNEMAQARINGRRAVLQAAQRLPHRQKKTG